MWKCGIFECEALHNMTLRAIMRLQCRCAENSLINSEILQLLLLEFENNSYLFLIVVPLFALLFKFLLPFLFMYIRSILLIVNILQILFSFLNSHAGYEKLTRKNLIMEIKNT